eukprot:IDg21448t1
MCATHIALSDTSMPKGTDQDQLRPLDQHRSAKLPRAPDHQELKDPLSNINHLAFTTEFSLIKMR